MKANYEIINFENLGVHANHSLPCDILEGLSSNPKFIRAKYHYDENGSKLFQQITQLREYYPTRCELENLKHFKNEFAQIISDKPFKLIELGVGDAHKTKILLQHFTDIKLPFEYIPVDCCEQIITNLMHSLKSDFNHTSLNAMGIVADYFHALNWLKTQNSTRNVVLFLGSNIGNFTPKETRNFLYHLWSSLKDGDFLLIGFDLKKDIDMLENAYDDKTGVTKAFNLNLLNRINVELGADFNPNKFKYHSFYNPNKNCVESWLMSTEEQMIKIDALQKEFYFDAWEGIHVENSYKYNLKEIENLALSTGFMTRKILTDNKGYFAEAIWEVTKAMESLEEISFANDKKPIANSIY